jgi:mono/diheme cytochrome c family protein
MIRTRRQPWLRDLGGVTLLVLATTMGTIETARAQAPAGAAADVTLTQVTFTKDILPILQRSCQNCHRPNNIAPMSFLTYQDVRPWSKAIKAKVVKREMPPWFIDRNVGIRHFKDDPSLTDPEIAAISAWVDAGSPEGNRAEMPPPRQFQDADRWHIGTPDLIVSMPVEFTVKPHDSDWWGNFVADSGLTEDRYIKAVETKPSPGGGIRIVHHAVTSLIDDDGVSEGGTLNEYAVGKNGDIYPDGAGKLIKAGAKIRFNLHYHAIGEAISDRTSVAFIFYPRGYVPKHVITTVIAESKDIDIPPGEDNVRTDSYYKLAKPARLTGIQPHMHNRGKAECIEAIYPTMAVEQLSCVSRYNFGWQIVYNYADDVAPLLPSGTILHIITWHDNSTKNPWNPDPRAWVGYGERTIEDMSRAWLNFYYMSDEEFKAEVAARNAQKPKLTSQR